MLESAKEKLPRFHVFSVFEKTLLTQKLQLIQSSLVSCLAVMVGG